MPSGGVANAVRRLIRRVLQGHGEESLVGRFGAAGAVVRVRTPSVIYDPERIHAGHHVDIGEFCHIRAAGGLTIGDYVLIASSVVITTQNHPVDPPRWGVTQTGPVAIGDHVWIGAGAVILPNVSIGEGSVVAAGAVVTSDVPAYVVAAGVPAAVKRKIPRRFPRHERGAGF